MIRVQSSEGMRKIECDALDTTMELFQKVGKFSIHILYEAGWMFLCCPVILKRNTTWLNISAIIFFPAGS